MKNNVSGDLTSNRGNSGPATADVTVYELPAFSKSFGSATLALGDTTTLSFVIDNSNNVIDMTSAQFTDELPSGLEFADPDNLSTTCVGPSPNIVSPTQLDYFGFTILAGTSCQVDVDVTGISLGVQNNVSSTLDLVPSIESIPPATADIEVISPNDLGITKGNGMNFLLPGQTFDYTIVVSNLGAGDATGVDVFDTIGGGLDGANATWTCVASPGATLHGQWNPGHRGYGRHSFRRQCDLHANCYGYRQ